MLIEINDEQLDEFVRRWLEELRDTETDNLDHPDDILTWDEMKVAAATILRLNWSYIYDTKDD